MVLHLECFNIEKEANKHHSGRLINQDQGGRIGASYITSTRMISDTRPQAAPSVSCNNTDITLVVVI